MSKPRLRFLSGQSLIEMLLAIAVFVVFMATIGVIMLDASATQRKSVERLKAVALVQEGIEAARAIRDARFGDLTLGTYGLTQNGVSWSLAGASDTVDGYRRTIAIGDAGTGYRYVTSTVSWEFLPGSISSVSFSTILSDWHRMTTSTWANPDIIATSTFFGYVAAYAVQASGNRLYISTPQNAVAPEFYIYDITNEAVPVQIGSLELGFNCYSLGVSGTRAYVASDNNPDEVKIIDVSSSSKPLILGSIKLTGTQNVNSISVNGNSVHFVRDPQGNQATYYIYNTANPASPQLLGSIDLNNGAYDVALRPGNPTFAFFAAQENGQEFKTVNYTDPAHMAVSGYEDIGGSEDFHAVAVSTTLAYAGSMIRDSRPEFNVFNVADPLHPEDMSGIEIGADVNRIEIVRNLAFLATASSTAQFIVVDVTKPAAPFIYGKTRLAGAATDVAMSPSGDYAYVTTDSPNAGLYVITLGK